MMIALIILVVIVLLAIVGFGTWFFSLKADGNCPICALKSLNYSKITIDTQDIEDYQGGGELPIMGWSSWNKFRNHIDEDTIIQIAQSMARTGLADAGYRYVNIDDCWQSSMRDENGMLQGDLESFPGGMEALSKAINSYGLKMGLYTSNGTLTCEDLPASLGNERIDAKTLAAWGVEYFKYDFCHNEKISGKTPIIEYIDISSKGEHASIRLSPDRAKYTGRAKAVVVKDLPTQKGIAFLNHNAGKATFLVTAPQDGEYVFTIHYKKMTSRKKEYLQLDINGKIHEVFFPASIAFTSDARVQFLARLEAGQNSITLQNPIVTRADSAYTQYMRMGKELQEAANDWSIYTNTPLKPITYSICEWGVNHPYHWGAKAGNMWRTTHDIIPRWSRIVQIYNHNVKLYEYASPGHVNDPDMLEVGNGKLTPEENKSHFTLWCMMAAPLVLGNDLRLLENDTKESKILMSILTNEELIEIDQDPLVKPCKRIGKKGEVDILARPLANGDVAICFFNKSSTRKEIEYDLNDLKEDKYLRLNRTNNAEITELWTGEISHRDSIKDVVPGHGVRVFRISVK